MSKTSLSLTPAELAQIECTPEEGAELVRRRARRNRQAMLAELEADLPKLRARAQQSRSLNGVLVSAQGETATATPSAPADVAFVWARGRGITIHGIALSARRALHFVPREAFDAWPDTWVRGFAPDLRARDLLVIRDGVGDDLVGALSQAIDDPIHGTPCGEGKAALLERLLEDVIAKTGDSNEIPTTPEALAARRQLQTWLRNADDGPFARIIRGRLLAVFGERALREVA